MYISGPLTLQPAIPHSEGNRVLPKISKFQNDFLTVLKQNKGEVTTWDTSNQIPT